MNFTAEIKDYQKTPQGFYYDLGLGNENTECIVVVNDVNYLLGLEMKIEKIHVMEPMEWDEYICYCCISNLSDTAKTYTHEYYFTMFVHGELNNYYLINDHNREVPERYPVDETYYEPLDVYPELLKLVFLNPPEYTDMT